MSYISQSEVEAELPPTFMVEALDDDGDGLADTGLWEKIESSAAEEIDGILGQRYTVPFTAPIPAIVKATARLFVLEKLYFRRGIDPNPYAKRADEMRRKLNRIADGEEPLTPGSVKTNTAVTAITEPARTTSTPGHLST